MLTRTLMLFGFGLAAVLFAASQSDAQPGKGPGKGFGKGPGAKSEDLEAHLERLLEQVRETKAKLAAQSKGQKGQQGQQGQFGGKGKGFEAKKAKDEPKKEFGKGKGGWGGPGGFGPPWMKGKEGFGPPWMKGKEGFGGKGGPQGKLDPDTIRERYQYYKKLYDELPKSKGKGFERKMGGFEPKGKGPKGFEGKGPKGKEGFPPKDFGGKGRKGFEGKGPKDFDMKKGGPGGGPPGQGGSVEARIDRLIRELEQLRNEVRGGKRK